MAVQIERYTRVVDFEAWRAAWEPFWKAHADICTDGSSCRVQVTFRTLRSLSDPEVYLCIDDGWTPENRAAFEACEVAQEHYLKAQGLAQQYETLTVDHYEEVWSGTYH
ncbi:MAG: hypothetical protein WCI29_09595 [Actinomycetes bacterium]